MPELPEVETVRRGLAPVMEGAVILDIEQRRPDLRFPLPPGFVDRLKGRRIRTLRRRAKFLVADLDDGNVLIMHLGMSGRFSIRRANVCSGAGADLKPGRFFHEPGGGDSHDHVVFELSSGAIVVYNDVRRFGYMDLVPGDGLAACRHFSGLGPEPLGNAFNANVLAAAASGRAVDLKAFLLDQRTVAGLGNIYVCEALFRARLSPMRKARSLIRRDGAPSVRTDRLVAAIRNVLREAIEAGGSTLRDYAQADGSLGYFQHRFRVYGREGEPCLTPGCQGRVQRRVQAGRSTFWCGTCQR